MAKLEDSLRTLRAARGQRRADSVKRVMFPRQFASAESQKAAAKAAYNKSIGPILNAYTRQQSALSGDENELKKLRGRSVDDLMTNVLRDVAGRVRASGSADVAKINGVARAMTTAQQYYRVAEALTRQRGSSGSANWASMSPGEADAELETLATNTFAKLINDVTPSHFKAEGLKAGAKVPEEYREKFMDMIDTMYRLDPPALGPNGSAFASAMSEFNLGVNHALPGEGMGTADVELILDQAGVPVNEEFIRQLVRMQLMASMSPDKMPDLVTEFHNNAARYGLGEMETSIVSSLGNTLGSFFGGNTPQTEIFLEHLYGSMGLSDTQQGFLDSNTRYTQMLMENMQSNNATPGVRAARDMVFGNPEFQAFKSKHGYQTNMGALKDLQQQLKEADKTKKKHDRLLLRAKKSGRAPESIRAFEALQNNWNQPKEDESVPTAGAELNQGADTEQVTVTPGAQNESAKSRLPYRNIFYQGSKSKQ